MRIFKTVALKWWQVSMLKLAMVALGVAIGAAWPEFFRYWTLVLLGIFIFPAAYLTYVWLEQ